ncbi:hypothetical protein CMO92_01700 [Candidatus Woesearchaeota archaeon]|nr:hypothetical protein [Candidatus Woesearchaeota archaeon]
MVTKKIQEPLELSDQLAEQVNETPSVDERGRVRRALDRTGRGIVDVWRGIDQIYFGTPLRRFGTVTAANYGCLLGVAIGYDQGLEGAMLGASLGFVAGPVAGSLFVGLVK